MRYPDFIYLDLNFKIMKRAFLSLLLVLLISSFAFAQQPSSSGGQAVISDEMVGSLVKFDQKRFNLTADQVVKDRKVLVNYQQQSNAISQNPPTSTDQLKAATLKTRLALTQGYKSFLTSDQYSHYVETYNKMHPAAQIH